jgi:hypothetical protein
MASMNMPGVVFSYTSFPGLSAIDGLEDIGGCVDGHDDGYFAVEGFDIAEITPLIAGTVIQVQVLPPSRVFPTVPALPLTQTMSSLTALRPAEGAMGACGEQLDGRLGGGGGHRGRADG